MKQVDPLTLRGDPEMAARQAGLRYCSDDEAGYIRKGCGRGFAYYTADGKHVKDKRLKARFNALVIPPAWQDVWICSHANGHLQATGTDGNGRKQYLYHSDWHGLRSRAKFDALLPFGKVLTKLRKQVERDLKTPGLGKTKIVATVVKLLDDTLVRIGNKQYAEENGSYGLTTLRKRHVEPNGNKLELSFKGKSGVAHDLSLTNRRVVDIVRQCYEIPGYTLFKYFDDDGNKAVLDSADINDYLFEVTEQPFSAKDFRTWAGTALCAEALNDLAEQDLTAEKRAVQAVRQVAERLRNTEAVCRSSYIHPVLLKQNEAGSFSERFKSAMAASSKQKHLSRVEAALLVFLETFLTK